MADLVIKNGTVVTPQGSFEGGIGIENGKIVAVGSNPVLPEARETLDAKGLHILPGVIDDHVHFREPGMTYKEDFESGSRAAAFGGDATGEPRRCVANRRARRDRPRTRCAAGRRHRSR